MRIRPDVWSIMKANNATLAQSPPSFQDRIKLTTFPTYMERPGTGSRATWKKAGGLSSPLLDDIENEGNHHHHETIRYQISDECRDHYWPFAFSFEGRMSGTVRSYLMCCYPDNPTSRVALTDWN